jgi:Rieske Fe-S protein
MTLKTDGNSNPSWTGVNNQSVWMATSEVTPDAPLNQDETADVCVVGGEDHKTGQEDDTADRYERLEQWTRQRFPSAGQIQFRWSGQVMETLDGLAYIGHNPLYDPNVYIVTGDSGMGMTHCTIAGILLTDLIVVRENRWAELYDPSRKRIQAAPTFARETSNVIAQYADLLTGGEVDSADEIADGTGAILRRGLSKIAGYRDQQGVLHERSAICPHMGCVVGWNSAEKTWDCPCHGSRFDRNGRVLNGPAISDLAQAEPVQTDNRSVRKSAI